MATDAYAIIRAAVINKQQVIAYYDGHRREMCPHIIGRSNAGRPQALFYQFGGSSTTGLPPGGQWRCMAIDRLSDVSVREGPWHTGQGHSRPQTCVARIDAEVSF